MRNLRYRTSKIALNNCLYFRCNIILNNCLLLWNEMKNGCEKMVHISRSYDMQCTEAANGIRRAPLSCQSGWHKWYSLHPFLGGNCITRRCFSKTHETKKKQGIYIPLMCYKLSLWLREKHDKAALQQTVQTYRRLFEQYYIKMVTHNTLCMR